MALTNLSTTFMKFFISRNKKPVSLILFLFIGALCYGQCEIAAVNLELIPYNTVKSYIQKQKEHNIISFFDIKPSWTGYQEGYHIQKKTYKIKESLNEVWNKYKTTSPADAWNGKKIMFGFMYSKQKEKPVYAGETINQIDTGQVVFLNLKLLKFYNLAMAFEIIAVDPINKIIEFSYIEGNVSQGKQSLQFVDSPGGYTKIIHSSYFKSDSKLRDKFLYPFFHTRTTNEFHRIMRKAIYDS